MMGERLMEQGVYTYLCIGNYERRTDTNSERNEVRKYDGGGRKGRKEGRKEKTSGEGRKEIKWRRKKGWIAKEGRKGARKRTMVKEGRTGGRNGWMDGGEGLRRKNKKMAKEGRK